MDINQITKEIQDDIESIPESIFREQYAKFFFEPNADFHKAWTKVAGRDTLHVKVVDENGKELFRVPPITVKPNMADSGINIAGVLTEIAFARATHPNKGRHYENLLREKIFGSRSIPNEDQKRWLHIYEEYVVGHKLSDNSDDIAESVDALGREEYEKW